MDTATLVTATVGLPIQEVAAMDVSAATLDTTISGSALTALQLIDDIVAVLGTATYTETSTKGAVIGAVRNDTLAALAGTDNEIAPLQVNASGALYIQEGAALDVSAATLTVNAHAVTNAGAFAVQPTAASTGGCKGFFSNDLDQTEEDIATGACTVYGIYAWNATAAPLWLQIFNTNTVTVGTTAPTFNFIVPANADSDGAGVVIPIPVQGLAFSTALTMAMTTGVGTDNGAPGANEGGVFVTYQD